jgi:hypothetical protein
MRGPPNPPTIHQNGRSGEWASSKPTPSDTRGTCGSHRLRPTLLIETPNAKVNGSFKPRRSQPVHFNVMLPPRFALAGCPRPLWHHVWVRSASRSCPADGGFQDPGRPLGSRSRLTESCASVVVSVKRQNFAGEASFTPMGREGVAWEVRTPLLSSCRGAADVQTRQRSAMFALSCR